MHLCWTRVVEWTMEFFKRSFFRSNTRLYCVANHLLTYSQPCFVLACIPAASSKLQGSQIMCIFNNIVGMTKTDQSEVAIAR